MSKRIPAATYFNDPTLSDTAKLLRVVNVMCGLPADIHNNYAGRFARNFAFAQLFAARFQTQATPEQQAALIKLHDMGWEIGKLVWNDKLQKIAFAVQADGCAGWVTPDGKLTRAPMGKRTAVLERGWEEISE